MTASAQTPARSDFMSLLIRFREVGILLFTVLLIGVVTILSPVFLTTDNFGDIVLNISILTIVGLAQMMVIITRGIDLSVGSMIGLVAMMVAFTVVAFPTMHPLLIILLGIALGAVLGSINGAVMACINFSCVASVRANSPRS